MNAKIGRNDPCACGSGKKSKKCCGQNAELAGSIQGSPQATDAVAGLSHIVALMNAGRYPEVEATARELLVHQPRSGILWKALSVSLGIQGKDALQALRMATMYLPRDPEVHSNLANALLSARQFNEAAASSRAALAINPDLADAHNHLGLAHLGSGDLDEAVVAFQRTITLRPQFAEAHGNLGNAYLRGGSFDAAATSYRRALALKPDFLDAHNNLGNALQALGQLEDAIASYQRALRIKPSAELHNNLGVALRGLANLELAEQSYRRALLLNPDHAQAHNNLGVVLREQGRAAEAEASCRAALAIQPNLAATIALLGELCADDGQFDEADRLFKRALSIDAALSDALVGLARLRKMTREDADWLAAAERAVAVRLPTRDTTRLHYTLGKYFDDIDEYTRAFHHYRAANELQRQTRSGYDRVRQDQTVDRIILSYDAAWLAQPRPVTPSDRPVLIVGMPRSGTTLTEQILASHPAVAGVGELVFWENATAILDDAPDAAAREVRLVGMGRDYLERLDRLSPDALRIVDKMPGNFWSLGLIHAALPGSRIIHMRRDPLDTCLSIYFQNFETGHAYANDLEDLAHYYSGYLRVMQHWRATLAKDSMLEVPYDGLVQDQETWTRRMLEFIGVPWDSRCLEFHETQRSVITLSKWQVRQKINNSSVGRWHHYESFVGPLRRLHQEICT